MMKYLGTVIDSGILEGISRAEYLRAFEELNVIGQNMRENEVIFNEGDDLAALVIEALLAAQRAEGFEFHDRDVLAVTESVLARTQGNYATVEQIAADVRRKFPGGVAGIVLPILSRNRFSLLLEGISRGLDKLYIQLAYPSDEVGNHLVSLDMLDEKGIDPVTDVLSEQR